MPFDVSSLVDMPRVTSVAWSPDGTWLAVEVQVLDDVGARYVSELWRVPLKGTPTKLELGPGSHRAPAFRADGALGYLSNRDPESAEPPTDDARSQVWLHDGTEAHPLTDEPLGASAFAFGGSCLVVVAPVLLGVPHGEQRALATDRKKHGPSALHYRSGTVRHWDHWVSPEAPHFIAYDADGAGRRDLTPNADREHREASWDLTEDGTRLAVTWARPSHLRLEETPILVLDTRTGAATTVFDAPCESASGLCWAPDGSRIAFTRTEWSEHACIRERRFVMNADGSDLTELAPEWDRWATPVGWSRDGRQLYVEADDEARHRIFAIDVASHAVRTLPEAGGSHGALVCGEHGIAGIRHSLASAPEAFVWPHGAKRARTVSALAGQPDVSTRIEEHTVVGAGGDPVQTWLLLPEGDGPFPVLVWIHGGPMGAWGDQWHWRWNSQVALAAGYAVALPNPRGSTGFGQPFIDGIWGNEYGAACFEDVMAVTDFLATDPRLDGDRMAAMGGSFGGYMVNWIGGNTGDRFRCLITHASLFDLPRFYGVTDHPAFWLLKMGITPWSDPDGFVRYSPHTRVPDWKAPTLVIHGERDYRVPVGEGIALYEALQLHGVRSELLVFPDENHWILKPRNVHAWYGHVLEFLGEHV